MNEKSLYLRYALVRARKQVVNVDDQPLGSLGPDELRFVGPKEFLAIMARQKLIPNLTTKDWRKPLCA